jgi:hypothetical protein
MYVTDGRLGGIFALSTLAVALPCEKRQEVFLAGGDHERAYRQIGDQNISKPDGMYSSKYQL